MKSLFVRATQPTSLHYGVFSLQTALLISLFIVTDEDGKWLYFKDPWEAQLAAPEPLPEYYDTKEEYPLLNVVPKCLTTPALEIRNCLSLAKGHQI